jgi:hypothetical protein
MSVRTKEYTKTFIVTKSQLEDMVDAMFTINRHGFSGLDESQLTDGLSAVGSVLSFAFMLPTAVSLSAGIVGALSSGLNNADAYSRMCERGEKYLQHLSIIMDNNPEITNLKIEMPCLEFVDQDFRIFSGYGDVLKVRAYREWVYPGQFPEIKWKY